MHIADKEILIARELEDVQHLLTFDLSRFSPHVRASLDVIHAEAFDPALNVAAVYEACAVNSHTLAARFRQEVEVGMREYIENVRLLAAMRLLEYEEIELHLIASTIGYDNYETFGRAFKRRTGHPPSVFRDIYRSESKTSTRQNTDRSKRQHSLYARRRSFMQRRPALSVRFSSSLARALPTPQPFSLNAAPIMQITDVRGLPADDTTLESLEVEGKAPNADKVNVTVEVTGKQLSKSVTVRKDETWTARFKDNGKTDLSGFACGALVAAVAVASGDDTQRVSWQGCLPCGSEGGDGAADASERRNDEETVGDDQAARRSSSVGSEDAEPLVVVERRTASESGDAIVTVRVAESSDSVAYRTKRDADDRERSRDAESRSRRRDDRRQYDRRQDDRRQDDRQRNGADEARDEDRPDESRLAPHPEDQDHARHRDDSARSEGGDRDQSDDKEHEDEDEGTPMWLGGLLAFAEAGFLVSIAAQAYPLIVGGAAAFMLAVMALFFAKAPARSWAVWTFGGIGLAAVAIAAMLPFFDFVGFDTYLLAAGIAAAGLATGAGLLMFASGDDESDDA